jgi:RNA polymerase sigma factor for flagellar operon FliA
MTIPQLDGSRQQRILDGLPAATAVAERISRRLPRSVDVDDLVGAARVGLIEATDRFQGSRGVPFEAYAHTRMQGAVLDALRADDHLSRRGRRQLREADAAEEQLGRKLNRALSADEQRSVRRGEPVAQPRSMVFIPLDECGPLASDDAPGNDALAGCIKAELMRGLRSAVATLAHREQLVLSLYYERELTYREIGVVLGVSESRICQILRVIHGRLWGLLGDPDALLSA